LLSRCLTEETYGILNKTLQQEKKARKSVTEEQKDRMTPW